jgi:hypothetical protein
VAAVAVAAAAPGGTAAALELHVAAEAGMLMVGEGSRKGNWGDVCCRLISCVAGSGSGTSGGGGVATAGVVSASPPGQIFIGVTVGEGGDFAGDRGVGEAPKSICPDITSHFWQRFPRVPAVESFSVRSASIKLCRSTSSRVPMPSICLLSGTRKSLRSGRRPCQHVKARGMRTRPVPSPPAPSPGSPTAVARGDRRCRCV